jgi:Domain of unknown function (DUF4157)
MRTHALVTREAARPGLAAMQRAPALRSILLGAGAQPKLRVGAVDDPAEAEADRTADRIMRMPDPKLVSAASEPPPDQRSILRRKCAHCEEKVQRKETQGASHAGGSLSPAAESAVSSLGPGAPLPASERAFFEPRFGHSLGRVRVHDGAQAAYAASAINARAFALGSSVAFARGEYQPGTQGGRELMAHELAHVGQGHALGTITRKGGDQTAANLVSFNVKIPLGTATAEEFRRYAEVVIFGRHVNFNWQPNAKAAEAYANISAHVGETVTFRMPTATLKAIGARSGSDAAADKQGADAAFGKLDPAGKSAVNEEVDSQYNEAIGAESGAKIKSGETGKVAIWNDIRQQLLLKKKALDELPEGVRKVLFDPEAARQLPPSEYDTALRVGQKLAAMSDAELAIWKSRTTAVTDDWQKFENSIDAYLQSEALHKHEQLELGRAGARIYNLLDLYFLVKNLEGSELVGSLSSRDEFGVEDPTVSSTKAELPELRQSVQTALKQNGFASTAEFYAALAAWRVAFERETVRTADVLLDQLDHVLFESELRYGKAAESDALATAVVRSGAPGHFQEAEDQAQKSISLSAPRSAMNDAAIDENGAMEAATASAAASKQGKDALLGLSESHPLLAFEDFPHGQLGRASPGDMKSVMLGYLAGKRHSIDDTRKEIHSDREFIYKLGNLMHASRQAQDVEPGSIYDHVLNDYIEEEGIKSLLGGLALAIITIALGIASMGTGFVAAAAAGAALGISTFQALDAFSEYERQSAAKDAELLSDDPSLGWLVIAVVGAAVDLGAAVQLVRALKPAALALQETSDIASFRAAVESVPKLEKRMQSALIKAGEAEQAISKQWKAVTAIANGPNEGHVAAARSFGHFMVLAWHNARRGIYKFEHFLAAAKKAGVIKSIKGLSPEEFAALRGPFDEGLRRALEGFLPDSVLSQSLRTVMRKQTIDDAAAFGRFLGLSDDEVVETLELQALVYRETGDAAEISETALQTAMRERTTNIYDELVTEADEVKAAAPRKIGTIEVTHDVAALQGRQLLESKKWQQWPNWVNPFEFHGRYGQGIDDIFIDGQGKMWIIEYKGGTAQLTRDQMQKSWVLRNILRIEKHAAKPENAAFQAIAKRLRQEFDAGTLRGAVVRTPHGSETRIAETFGY